MPTATTLLLALIGSLCFRLLWRFFLDGNFVFLRESISFLVIWLIFSCAGCQSKTKPVSAPTIIYADTTRVKLVHRADSSGKALTIIQARTNQTVTSYEQAVNQYDSIQVTLP